MRVEEVDSGNIHELECEQFAKLKNNDYTIFIQSFYDPLTSSGKGGGVAR